MACTELWPDSISRNTNKMKCNFGSWAPKIFVKWPLVAAFQPGGNVSQQGINNWLHIAPLPTSNIIYHLHYTTCVILIFFFGHVLFFMCIFGLRFTSRRHDILVASGTNRSIVLSMLISDNPSSHNITCSTVRGSLKTILTPDMLSVLNNAKYIFEFHIILQYSKMI